MIGGPFGFRGPFRSDERTILILVGVDGSAPPNSIQLNLQESVNREVNRALIKAGQDISLNTETVNLTVEPNPSKEQRDVLGPNVIHVQQYDIATELEEVSQELVNGAHNTVINKVDQLGFNIADSRTTVS
jgi:hypothetical protein